MGRSSVFSMGDVPASHVHHYRRICHEWKPSGLDLKKSISFEETVGNCSHLPGLVNSHITMENQ
jgi:hypothetical protein